MVYSSIVRAKAQYHICHNTVKAHPGFGCFRNELFNLLSDGIDLSHVRSLDNYMQVILPSTDIVCEMFSNSGSLPLFSPYLLRAYVSTMQSL